MKTFAFAAAALIALSAVACSANGGDGSEAATSNLGAEAPITLASWRTDPQIVAINAEVEAIDAAAFAPEKQEDLCQDQIGESSRAKLSDRRGIIRKLERTFGSEDSFQTISLYYNEAGKLRFAKTARADVFGNVSQALQFFTEEGGLLWDVTRHASDPKLQADIEKAPYERPAEEMPLPFFAHEPAQMWASPAQCN